LKLKLRRELAAKPSGIRLGKGMMGKYSEGIRWIEGLYKEKGDL